MIILEPQNLSVNVREYLFEPPSAVERDAWLQALALVTIEGQKQRKSRRETEDESARRSSVVSLEGGGSLGRTVSIRRLSGGLTPGDAAAAAAADDPYAGVTTLLEHLGCAHLLQV